MFLSWKSQYGNAASDDLWDALTHQAELDKVQLPTNIKTIMDSWTLKMGYPVVTVQRDYSSATAALSQVKSSHLSRNFFRQINAFALLFCKKRFLLYSVSPTIDDTTYRWWIPLTYTSDFKETNYEWLSPNETEDSTEISLEQVTEDDWVIFNINQVGQLVTQQLDFSRSVQLFVGTRLLSS